MATGLLGGLVSGVMLAIVSLVIAAIVGMARFESQIGSILVLARDYIAGGACGGLIGGLLHPIGRSVPGAIILCILAVIPLSVIFGVRVFGPMAEWSRGEVVFSVMWTLGLGSYIAVKGRRVLAEGGDLSNE